MNNTYFILCDLGSIDPFFGDHVLVEFKVAHNSCKNEIVTCRDWRNYSKELLYEMLRSIDWEVNIDNVQEFWNVFENKHKMFIFPPTYLIIVL